LLLVNAVSVLFDLHACYFLEASVRNLGNIETH